jgi:3-(3-hydroxy-phenyl)propionate hydroxylase
MVPGAPSTDAPIRTADGDGWFLQQIGNAFAVVYFGGGNVLPADLIDGFGALADGPVPVRPLVVVPPGAGATGVDVIEDAEGALTRRFDAQPGTCYLLRPDQHVCARWRRFDTNAVRAALARVTATG